jgi:uncharacterized membrane protein
MEARRYRWVTLTAGWLASACAGDPSEPSVASGLTFCDVEPVLANKCQRCHGDPPRNGAPFALLSFADTQAPAPTPTDPNRRRFQDMQRAIEQGEMPYRALDLDPPVQALTCEERTTLLSWLKPDAREFPSGATACPDVTPHLLPCDDDL